MQLQWGTYYDAADQAGLSRLYGGIHVSVDDLTGRVLGSQCGLAAWNLAKKYYDGSVAHPIFAVTMNRLNTNQLVLRWPTLRGMYYKLQSTTNLNQSFADEPGGSVQALDTISVQTNSLAGARKFYRVANTLTP